MSALRPNCHLQPIARGIVFDRVLECCAGVGDHIDRRAMALYRAGAENSASGHEVAGSTTAHTAGQDRRLKWRARRFGSALRRDQLSGSDAIVYDTVTKHQIGSFDLTPSTVCQTASEDRVLQI